MIILILYVLGVIFTYTFFLSKESYDDANLAEKLFLSLTWPIIIMVIVNIYITYKYLDKE